MFALPRVSHGQRPALCSQSTSSDTDAHLRTIHNAPLLPSVIKIMQYLVSGTTCISCNNSAMHSQQILK
jgi:hypothetical protein